MFIVILQAMLTLFFVGIIGFYLIKKKLFSIEVLDALSPLLLEVALPSLIFVRIIENFNYNNMLQLLKFPVSWLVFTVYTLAFAKLLSYLSCKQYRREFFMTLFFQNGMFVPIILITHMYGEKSEQLLNLFLFTLFYAPMFFNTYHLFFRSKRHHFNFKKVFHPVLLSTILALTIKIAGFSDFVPTFVTSALALVGNMTIPLLMIIIGGNIYVDLKQGKKFRWLEVSKFVFVKNILFPMVTLAIIVFFKLDPQLAIIVLIQSAVPPLMALPIFASRAGGNRHIVSQFLVVSFIFSAISLPFILTGFTLLSTQ